jgi:polyhydroxybutyrate depolymerase
VLGFCGLVLLSVLVGAGAATAVEVPAVPSAGCRARAIERGRRLERSIDLGGTRRSYILDVPDGVKVGEPVPLLFDFHGFRHSGAGVWKVSKFRDLAAEDPFLTVYPEGQDVRLKVDGKEYDGKGWKIDAIDGNRDLAFVAAMLDEIERRYCIDRERVFATGFSNGGFFSVLLACAMAERFAAVAPVGAGPLAVPCTPGRAVPILIHHGRRDGIVPVERARSLRDRWIERNGCRESASDGCERHTQCRDGAVVEYCEDDSPHTWPAPATKRIRDFFRRHPLR